MLNVYQFRPDVTNKAKHYNMHPYNRPLQLLRVLILIVVLYLLLISKNRPAAMIHIQINLSSENNQLIKNFFLLLI